MKTLSTQLNDRELRFDGVSILDPVRVPSALARGVQPAEIRVTEISDDVNLFNKNVEESQQILMNGPGQVSIDMSWRLPPSYQNIDLEEHVLSLFMERSEELGFTLDADGILRLQKAEQRIFAELNEVRRRGMVDFMKTIVYVLDIFRAKGVVWGVGRGSSCASYVLFVLGLHSVDCLKYDVPMEEFFHD